MQISMIFSRIYVLVSEMRWYVLFMLVIAHMALTKLGFYLAGEDHLMGFANFIYYYGTTASTIGYGDLSPQSPAGRLFAALFLFPVALVLFTVIIAKSTSTISYVWKKKINGLGDFSDVKNAILILGYHPLRTPRMIREIMAEHGDRKRIILVSDCDVSVDHAQITYVRASSLSSQADLTRAGAHNASKVIVYGSSDDQTLSAALSICAINDSAHVVAHFDEEEHANLLKPHTRVVCVISQAVEIMVREMRDPGVADVLNDISSIQQSVTLFSIELPDRAFQVSKLQSALASCNAILISHRTKSGIQTFCTNGSQTLSGGCIFYISEKRISAASLAAAL